MLSPQAKRGAVAAMQEKTAISGRRAGRLMGLSRTVLHDTPLPRPDNERLRPRLAALADERRRFGYRRLHALLRREGVIVNHKRVHCIYRSAGLAVRRRRKRHGVAVDREPLLRPTSPNAVWSMDFVFDALACGRRLKCLTLVDDFTRQVSGPRRGPRDRRTARDPHPRPRRLLSRLSPSDPDRPGTENAPARHWISGPTPTGSRSN